MPGVVEEPAQVPDARYRVGLHVVERVDRLAHDLHLVRVLEHGHLDLPQRPRPRAVGRLLVGVQVGRVPRLAAVRRHVHAQDAVAAAAERVAAHGDRAVDRLQHFARLRLAHDRVDGALVDRRRVAEVEAARVRRRRRALVVLRLPERQRLVGVGQDASEPLDASRADHARDDDAQRVAVVSRQLLAVHLVDEQHVAQRIGCLLYRDGHNVRLLRNVVVKTFKVDVLHLCVVFRVTGVQQDIPQTCPAPRGVADAGHSGDGAGHVLVLRHLRPPVARTLERRHHRVLLELAAQLVHAQHDRRLRRDLDLQLVRVDVDLGHGQVVADVEVRVGRDEVLDERVRQRLAVERLQAVEAEDGCTRRLLLVRVVLAPIRQPHPIAQRYLADLHRVEDLLHFALVVDRVQIPEGLDRVACCEQNLVASRMRVDELRDVVHIGAVGDPDARLRVVVLHDILDRVLRQTGGDRRRSTSLQLFVT